MTAEGARCKLEEVCGCCRNINGRPRLLFLSLAAAAILAGSFMGSIIFASKLEIGLNQQLSIPKDSYMVNYFNVC